MPQGRLQQWFARYLAADAAPLPWRERLTGALAAGVGIALLQAFLFVLPAPVGIGQLFPPIAASCVILFMLPQSPLAQPWPLVGGMLLSAVIGSVCGLWVQPAWLAVSLALAGAVWGMASLRCLHPPAGGVAVLFALAAPTARPVPLGVLALNLLAALLAVFLLNNLIPGRRYPQLPAVRRTEPASRRSISHDDLQHAIGQLNTYVDMREEDLVQLYDLAVSHAHQRHEQRLCRDVMSAPPLAIGVGGTLDEAWWQLSLRHLHGLPVVDAERRVVGVLTLEDFLRHTRRASTSTRQAMRQRWQGERAVHSAPVTEVMQTGILLARDDQPLSEIAAQLAARNHPVIVPVVDADARLCGVITQTDVLAALFHGQALARSNSAPARA